MCPRRSPSEPSRLLLTCIFSSHPYAMIPELHAYEQQYSLGGNGSVSLKVFVFKKINTLNLATKPVYLIKTALRVSIYNKQDFNIAAGSIVAYRNYPALFSFKQALTSLVPAEATNFKLLNYAPQTVNSSVTISGSNSELDAVTNTAQQSMGSSTSQTNSFGVNAQGGIMMGLPLFTLGANYDYAYSSAQSQERGIASSALSEQQAVSADSYSIKDWGVYAQVNRERLETRWICSQEYPWDVLQYRSQNGQGNIDLPKPVIARMLQGNCVLPPSQLSQFGTDFTFTAEWSFTPTESNVNVNTPLLSIPLTIAYLLASHERTGISPNYQLAASLSQPSTTHFEMTLSWGELECLALNPVMAARNDASLNFQKVPAARFPSNRVHPFTLTSPTNTLFFTASGFSPGMVVDVTEGPVSYTLKFKLTDTVGELSLYLKHWKLDAAGLVLTITVNDFTLPVQYVDALQGEGGMGNRTNIGLRSTDYMAEDFADYVVVGLNTVTVTVGLNDALPRPGVARYCLAAAVVS